MGGYRNTDPSTSKQAYEALRQSGRLTETQLQVAEVFLLRGEQTSGEGAVHIPTMSRNDFATRVTELVDKDVLERKDERPCKTTGRNCIVWGTTDRPPKDRKKDKPKKKTREQLVKDNKELLAHGQYLLKELRHMAKLFEKYGRHDSYCTDDECQCGFDKALEEVRCFRSPN